MSIQIKSICVVGFRFSDICHIQKNAEEIRCTFLIKELQKEVSKKFEGGRIDDSEVDAELLALIFDLDSFDYTSKNKKESIIGLKIVDTNLGEKNINFCNIIEVERAQAKIKEHVKKNVPKLYEKIKIEIILISTLKEEG